MKLHDQINLRKLLVAFFAGMAEYPNDTDRMEAGIKVIENWMDDVILREQNKLITAGSKITQGGPIRNLKN
jgi:hypothetical protein